MAISATDGLAGVVKGRVLERGLAGGDRANRGATGAWSGDDQDPPVHRGGTSLGNGRRRGDLPRAPLHALRWHSKPRTGTSGTGRVGRASRAGEPAQ